MRLAPASLAFVGALACAREGPRAREGPQASEAPTPSCPAAASEREVGVHPHFEVGVAGGVTWLYGHQRERPLLLHLDRRGDLAMTEAPLADAERGAVFGAQLWLYAPGRGDLPARWSSVDVTEADAPAPGPVETLALAGPSSAAAFAVGSERALLVLRSVEVTSMVVVDRTTRAPVGAPQPLPAGMVPLGAVCDARRCGVVAIRDEGGGPERRLVLVTTDGVREPAETQLAPGWIGAVKLDTTGERVVVAWEDLGRVHVRVVARAGLIPGEIVTVPGDARARSGVALLRGPSSTHLAAARSGDWWSAPIGEGGSLGGSRGVGGPGVLLGAPLSDGLVWLDIDARVELVSGMHLADTSIVAGFAPWQGAPTQGSLLSAADELQVHLLTGPGRAAVLVVPNAGQLVGPRFYPLRGVCP